MEVLATSALPDCVGLLLVVPAGPKGGVDL